jgi:hypothetical protein
VCARAYALQYPHTPPDVLVSCARGLTDDNIASLMSQIDQLVAANAATAVLYDIIQVSDGAHPHTWSL